MNEVLEQLTAEPWGRLALHHVAAGGMWNQFVFLLVSMRLTGVFVVAPCFQSQAIPYSGRIAFAILLSLIIAPTLTAAQPEIVSLTSASYEYTSSTSLPTTASELGCLLAGELGLGTLLGIGVICVLSGLRFGGEWLDRHSGLGIGSVLNPDWFSGDSACGAMAQLLGIAAFLLIEPIGGPMLFLRSLVESFHAIPLGASNWTVPMNQVLSGLVQQSLVLGLQIAMPLIAAMTLVDMTLAFSVRGSSSSLGASGVAIRTGVSMLILALTMTAFPETVARATLSMLQSIGGVH